MAQHLLRWLAIVAMGLMMAVVEAIDMDWDNLGKHKTKDLRQFLKERGVDERQYAGGEKPDLLRLVRESRDLPIKDSSAKPDNLKPKDKLKDKDLQDLLAKMKKETGMGFKMFTAEDLRHMDPEKMKEEL
eukprot:GGOE01014067.1.p2 GENE.GGOE01014067.1~~GGOE01014067.1.p2  ORF type:complete len:140 (-),score=50.62 GGOE01014067.1:262-651(-)